MWRALQVADRSQRATVRLQPSDQAVSVRVRELGERWESPAEPGGGDGSGRGGGGGDRGRDERRRSAAESEQDGGAASGGSKRKHKDRHKEKHRHRERDEGETQKRGRADEGIRCGCDLTVSPLKYNSRRLSVWSRTWHKDLARGFDTHDCVYSAMKAGCHAFLSRHTAPFDVHAPC